MNDLSDTIAICYTCCGPTYRETARDKLINLHTDNDQIYYLVITDDKKYFDGVNRQNLIVNELKDFYEDFPLLEKNEPFLESTSKNDYGEKFLKLNYKFPFSTNRYHMVQAKDHNIKIIIQLGTDTDFFVDRFHTIIEKDNRIYNSVSKWDVSISDHNIMHVVNILKDDFGLNTNNTVRAFDAAAKMFCFDSVDFMMRFFDIWDHVMMRLYEENKINLFAGSYAVNDEYILAPIYSALNIRDATKDVIGLFLPQHCPETERFWM